jgi:hypothetical protein
LLLCPFSFPLFVFGCPGHKEYDIKDNETVSQYIRRVKTAPAKWKSLRETMIGIDPSWARNGHYKSLHPVTEEGRHETPTETKISRILNDLNTVALESKEEINKCCQILQEVLKDLREKRAEHSCECDGDTRRKREKRKAENSRDGVRDKRRKKK